MPQDQGVAATPPGHSAEPEPKVSALRACVPNAELLELAGRVEEGERSDQEQLLTEAFEAIKGPLSTRKGSIVCHHPEWFAFQKMLRALAYESAALALVPEGWVRGVEEWPDPNGAHSRAWLKQTSTSRMGKRLIWGHASDDAFVEVKHAVTPALALCAASLRAWATCC